jgi:hypothetical protein
MDDVIAVAVHLADGGQRYFLTWGRIQDRADPGPVCELVLRFSRSCSLGGVPVSARLCTTLREAAASPDAPYFYECFLTFASRPVPSGQDYQAWMAGIAEKMQAGQEICYCGRPALTATPHATGESAAGGT